MHRRSGPRGASGTVTIGMVAESLRETVAATARTAGLLVVLAGLLGAAATIEMTTARELRAHAADVVDRGGDVLIASVQGATLPAAACADISRQPAVVAAGGLRSGGTLLTVRLDPGAPFRRLPVTAGLVRILDPSWTPDSRPGLLVPAGARDEIAAPIGGVLARPGGPPVQVAGWVDVQPRAPQFDRSLLEVVPATGQVDECWAEFTPAAWGPARGLFAGWLGAGDGLTVRTLLTRNELSRDVAAEFRDRPLSMPGPLAVGVLAALVVSGVTWSRRSQHALYRALGFSAGSIVVMEQVSTLVLLGVAWLVGMLWAGWVTALLGGVHAPEVLLAARTTAVVALVPPVVQPIVTRLALRVEVTEALRDR